MLLIIYMVWAELLLAIRLRACAQRLLASGYRDGSLVFFLAALALMVLWMGTGRLAPFARAAQLFLVVLLGTAAVVLVLSLGQVKAEHLLPLWSGDVPGILRSALPAFGVVGWGGWAAFLKLCEGEEPTVSDLDADVEALAQAGIVTSPDYWKTGSGYSDANVVCLIHAIAEYIRKER